MTITHTFETEIEDKKRSFPKITFMLIGVLVALGVVEIWVSHTLASYGEKFENIEKMKITLTLQNKILENRIASLNTLSEIATQSAELGFKKPQVVKYIR